MTRIDKMKNLEISVIMSVFNGKKLIKNTIESILDQTFKDFEFIIIDDCSADNPLSIIKNYIEQDKRIILIKNKKNLGLTKALNIGLKIAKGRYIARIDVDDIALPERLEKQFNYLEEHKDIFLVGTGAYNIDKKGNVKSIKKPLINPILIKKTLHDKNCIYHSSIMFRNERYLYRNKFIYTQDYDFYLKLLSNGKKISNLYEPLIKYKINPNSISWKKSTQQKLFAEKAREFYQQRLKYGKDEYEKFNPNEILLISVGKSTNKIVLESEIKTNFKFNKFKKVKYLCKIYFKYYGILNIFLIYYLLSFCGSKSINFLRKFF